MKLNELRIGIIHSLIGKNDGVSIVIDQTVEAMVKHLDINLGNFFFMAAHSSPRFNAQTNDVFWHKSEAHKHILLNFNNPDTEGLDELIHENALYAKQVIQEWVDENDIDLIIAHNTSHPYNFITAVGLGYYIEELRNEDIIWPKLMVWWHDSYFERDIFSNPNPVIKKYLKYLPGSTYVNGIAFINKQQIELGKKVFQQDNSAIMEKFFKLRTTVVPNTTEIPWEWEHLDPESETLICPPQDNYNNDFMKDIGLVQQVESRGFTMDDTVILLQHTRVVPRKKIELAIDLAFELEKKFKKNNKNKCVAVIVSGHSGDEQNQYLNNLYVHYTELCKANPDSNVVLIFGEHNILSHRDIIVDKKFYNFAEIPSIIAAHGGIGTYFSNVEGFGNNLLEMMSFALPAVINKYEVYKSEIEQYGFDLPAIDGGGVTDELVDSAYRLLTDIPYRNNVVKHNLKVLKEKLDHKIIADKLEPIIKSMYMRDL
ncbi:glycosyltransferase family 4 protein [Maribellus sediminis]|uniref:glycosyltransferase family 4 protein n=1 Tax=Maribellus sediminis TaxID=2696285 RepID=UPI0014305CFE|nr:glycosyltransferase family 4 protein [Maribellus sediminis]